MRDKNKLVGSGCSTMVEHTPLDHEFVGLCPVGCKAFLVGSQLSSRLSVTTLNYLNVRSAASTSSCWEQLRAEDSWLLV